jgi:tRNA1(Val) A37 N6-methylase TrmN6
VRIVRGDFRDLASLSQSTSSGTGFRDDPSTMESVASERYDLITGTPPYFRVDFTSSKGGVVPSGGRASSADDDDDDDGDDDGVITSAVIRQGGMPTSMQSAPARCEFRGGIEAYCLAASAMLSSSPPGMFVVCENWANDDRVWRGAEDAGLTIVRVHPVRGSVKKDGNLFAVYVMRKRADGEERASDDGERGREDANNDVVTMPPLVVRDADGKWTSEYANVLEDMSIPVV